VYYQVYLTLAKTEGGLKDEIQDLVAPIFIGGTGRSGTTLLRVILDSHPNIYSGGEIKVIPNLIVPWAELRSIFAPSLSGYYLDAHFINQQFRTLISSLFSKVLKKSGKKRIAEKTPGNLSFMPYLKELFEDAKFIHVIRDGRDVACSLIRMDWIDPLTMEKTWYTENIESAARYWKEAILAIREQARHPLVVEDYLEVRYENLVNSLKNTMEDVLMFLGEPWSDNVLCHETHRHHLPLDESSTEQVKKAVYSSACGRWRSEMGDEDREDFKKEANDLLVELGYAKDGSW
jgi:protein-tyrosine sulfotransferase